MLKGKYSIHTLEDERVDVITIELLLKFTDFNAKKKTPTKTTVEALYKIDSFTPLFIGEQTADSVFFTAGCTATGKPRIKTGIVDDGAFKSITDIQDETDKAFINLMKKKGYIRMTIAATAPHATRPLALKLLRESNSLILYFQHETDRGSIEFIPIELEKCQDLDEDQN